MEINLEETGLHDVLTVGSLNIQVIDLREAGEYIKGRQMHYYASGKNGFDHFFQTLNYNDQDPQIILDAIVWYAEHKYNLAFPQDFEISIDRSSF